MINSKVGGEGGAGGGGGEGTGGLHLLLPTPFTPQFPPLS